MKGSSEELGVAFNGEQSVVSGARSDKRRCLRLFAYLTRHVLLTNRWPPIALFLDNIRKAQRRFDFWGGKFAAALN